MFNITDGNIGTEKCLVCHPINDFKIDYEILLLKQFWNLSEDQLGLMRYKVDFSVAEFQLDLTYPIVQYFWRFIWDEVLKKFLLCRNANADNK